MKQFIVRVLMPLWYKFISIKKIKNMVLFIEIRSEVFTTNFIPIEKRFASQMPEYKIKKSYLNIGKTNRFKYFINCFKMLKVLAVSKYAFINDSSNVISKIKLRPETILVQTWHGCGALKKFGYCMSQKDSYYGNESIFTVSSPLVIPAFKEATRLSDEVIMPIGLPRTDLFFREEWKENVKRIREVVLDGRHKKIILYAPTFRGNVAHAEDPKGLNFDLMFKSLSQEYIIITKFHSALPPSKMDYRHKDFIYDVSDTMLIEDAMGICDILITDYSSLVFEYSLLNKPVIFYACDLDKYIADRGFFIDYEKEMPGRICKNTYDVIDRVKNGSYNPERMRKFRDKYMSSCDGHATDKLFNLMMEREKNGK